MKTINRLTTKEPHGDGCALPLLRLQQHLPADAARGNLLHLTLRIKSNDGYTSDDGLRMIGSCIEDGRSLGTTTRRIRGILLITTRNNRSIIER